MIPVTVIDYKAGNLTSVVKALRHLDADVTVTDRPEEVRAAGRVILPGVGHFAASDATAWKTPGSLTSAVGEVIARGVPFLGICVGHAMVVCRQHGGGCGEQPGLGVFAGHGVSDLLRGQREGAPRGLGS